MYVTAATHASRSYPEVKCSEAADYKFGTYHYVYIYGKKMMVFVEGNVSFTPFKMEPGAQITVEIAFDWRREGIKKDFSLVTWSDVEPLEI